MKYITNNYNLYYSCLFVLPLLCNHRQMGGRPRRPSASSSTADRPSGCSRQRALRSSIPRSFLSFSFRRTVCRVVCVHRRRVSRAAGRLGGRRPFDLGRSFHTSTNITFSSTSLDALSFYCIIMMLRACMIEPGLDLVAVEVDERRRE